MITNDRRSEADKVRTLGFVIATDKFMSGWGGAEGGSSYFAVPFTSYDDADLIEANMKVRPEMLRVRVVSAKYQPRTTYAVHFSIAPMQEEGSRWLTPGGWR